MCCDRKCTQEKVAWSDGNKHGGGGGGGGAILIASSTRIQINSSGAVRSRSGASVFNAGNGGSGGAIRLVAPRVYGTGIINVNGSGLSAWMPGICLPAPDEFASIPSSDLNRPTPLWNISGSICSPSVLSPLAAPRSFSLQTIPEIVGAILQSRHAFPRDRTGGTPRVGLFVEQPGERPPYSRRSYNLKS